MAAGIGDGGGADALAALHHHLDRAAPFRVGDGLLQGLGVERGAIDRQQPGAGDQARLERRPVPDHLLQGSIGRDGQAQREPQVVDADRGVGGEREVARGLAIDQPVSPALQSLQRRPEPPAFEALGEEARPVVGGDGLEGGHDVLELIGGGFEAAVLPAEEGPGEVVQRAAVAGALADQGVDLQPQQLALGIVVLAALPAGPGQGLAAGDDRVAGGVAQGPPASPGAVVVDRRRPGQGVEGLLARPEPGPRGQHFPPVLGLSLVDPHEAVADRALEAGRPGVGAEPELAVPRVDVFVGEDVPLGGVGGPGLEVAAGHDDLARPPVLDPAPADLVADRGQELVSIEMASAEQRVRLPDQGPVRVQLVLSGLQQVGAVGGEVQPDGAPTCWRPLRTSWTRTGP